MYFTMTLTMIITFTFLKLLICAICIYIMYLVIADIFFAYSRWEKKLSRELKVIVIGSKSLNYLLGWRLSFYCICILKYNLITREILRVKPQKCPELIQLEYVQKFSQNHKLLSPQNTYRDKLKICHSVREGDN